MQIRVRVVADRHVHARERLLHRRQNELTRIIQGLIRRQTRGARPHGDRVLRKLELSKATIVVDQLNTPSAIPAEFLINLHGHRPIGLVFCHQFLESLKGHRRSHRGVANHPIPLGITSATHLHIRQAHHRQLTTGLGSHRHSHTRYLRQLTADVFLNAHTLRKGNELSIVRLCCMTPTQHGHHHDAPRTHAYWGPFLCHIHSPVCAPD